jgi:hypothetical protein
MLLTILEGVRGQILIVPQLEIVCKRPYIPPMIYWDIYTQLTDIT